MKGFRVALVLAVLAVLAGLAAADVPIIVHDGHAYVDLARLGTDLKGKTDAKPGAVNAELRTGGHVVRFTRNWAQVLVDGAPVILDAPVRVKDGHWIVPKSFVADVVPLLDGAAASPASPASSVVSSLAEMRVRSYPSFTRVV